MFRLALIGVALCVLCSIALGDTIYLTNGRKMHGTIVKETEKEVVISIGKKQTITVKQDLIKKIEYNKRKGPDVAPPSTSENWPPKPEGKIAGPAKSTEKEEEKATKPGKKEEAKPLDPELKKEIEWYVAQLGLSRREHRGRRNRAMSELQRIGEPAVPFLINALKGGKNSKHREGAAKVLGAIGDKRGREPLVKQLRNSDKWVRKESVEALRKITSLNFGYDPEAESTQRETATKKWEEWWSKQKEKEEKAAEEAKKQEEAKKSEPEKPETKPDEKKEPESPKE